MLVGVHGEARGRSLLPEGLLVVGLSLLAAWVLRSIAPPSLVHDGKRLPVGMASRHASDHVTGAPSPVADAPLPHFLGGFFLTAHLLMIVLAIGIPLIRRLPANFTRQLLFAGLAAVTAGAAVVIAARFGYGDGLAMRDALLGGLETTRYAFIAAILVAVLFGVTTNQSTGRTG